MNTLEEIKKTIAKPMQHFNDMYREQLHSTVALVNEINDYLMARNGKQIRPVLVMLSAEAGMAANISQEEYDKYIANKVKLAMAMEILHNSTLMHDDVVDESPLRRGRETIKQRWSNKIAVLCGDFYLAQVMNILNEVNDPDVCMMINRTVIEMSEGELLQQQVSHEKDLDEVNYYNVIYKKTASLMATCCEIGYQPLREYGHQFGMAFQIRDDIMDYHSDSETGKPKGNDIKERKMTLPLLCYLKRVDAETRENTLKQLRQDILEDEEADAIVDRVVKSGALEDAYKILKERIDKAKEALSVVNESKYKTALIKLADMLIIK